MSQKNLYSSEPKRTQLGKSKIEYANVSAILTKPSGFASAYDFTLNPYSGCTFGCTYCYAAFFAHSKEQMDNWGHWVKSERKCFRSIKEKA